jgi:hypothetical protein
MLHFPKIISQICSPDCDIIWGANLGEKFWEVHHFSLVFCRFLLLCGFSFFALVRRFSLYIAGVPRSALGFL